MCEDINHLLEIHGQQQLSVCDHAGSDSGNKEESSNSIHWWAHDNILNFINLVASMVT